MEYLLSDGYAHKGFYRSASHYYPTLEWQKLSIKNHVQRGGAFKPRPLSSKVISSLIPVTVWKGLPPTPSIFLLENTRKLLP